MSRWQQWPRERWQALLEKRGVASAGAERLGGFLHILGRFTAAMDLVAPVDAEVLVKHHLEESLAAEPWLRHCRRVLDVGSGNGFPVIPLLCACPQLTAVLLEPRERRWAFLREVVRELELPADVVRERLKEHRGGGYDAATVRAVGLREWATELPVRLVVGGLVVWWRGPGEAEGLAGEGVVLSPLPDQRRGTLVVWRPCST